MEPRFIIARLRNQFFGATLVTAIEVCLSDAAMAYTDNFWSGTASSSWNDDANGSQATIPTKTGDYHAVINTTPSNIATITVGILPPVDIVIGAGAGNNGRVDHTGGEASIGSNNWMFVGSDGGAGVFNLGSPKGTSGNFTHLDTGNGTMTVNAAHLYIGGAWGSGSHGTVNVNTNGRLLVGDQLQVGTNSSAGVLNFEFGTITTNNFTEFGNGTGCKGTLNMSGGTLDNNSWTAIGREGGNLIIANSGSMVVISYVSVGFNGGVLKANAGATLNLMASLNKFDVKTGGATIDSKGQTSAINQNLLNGAGGGLTKTGDSFLQLNGSNTYNGRTSANSGWLGGTGSIAGPIHSTGAGTIAPGTSVGTFTSGSAQIAGTCAVEINSASSDQLDVNGDLDLDHASIAVSATAPVGTEWIIATYSGALSGRVASVGGSPTLVLTLPVRSGATFSGATAKVSNLIDGVIYTIQGSDQLVIWDLVVSEVLGVDKTTIENDLPDLDDGWEYRTFQSPGTVAGDARDFLRTVNTQP